MKFIGREEELRLLQKNMQREGQSIILIYGRRRVGKSELIKHLIEKEEITGIFYECRQISEQANVEALSNLLSESFGLPPLAFSNIEGTLRFLFEKAINEKLILALDEYPYLRESVQGMDSILKVLIDEYKEKSNLKLIICGSFIDTMKSLLENVNPLYGRIDRTLFIEPMDYYDSAKFYPYFSAEDKVKLYSVFGGLPYYNRLIDSKLSAHENIMELIVSDGARLENEVSMNLKSELSKLINANEVFDALSRGYSRFSDILSQSHVSSSPALSDILDKLIRMRVVEKISPINDENNKKKAGYYISDNLSEFYYRYLFRYSSQRRIMPAERFYERYVKDDFEKKYIPKVFEKIAKQFLIRKNKKGNFSEPFDRIGTYYYDNPIEKKNGQFDVVTEGEKGYLFFEVKYRDKKMTEQMIEEEIEQVKKAGLHCYKYGFIAKSGFEKGSEREDVILFSLRELYEEEEG